VRWPAPIGASPSTATSCRGARITSDFLGQFRIASSWPRPPLAARPRASALDRLRDEAPGRYVVDGRVWAMWPLDWVAPATGKTVRGSGSDPLGDWLHVAVGRGKDDLEAGLKRFSRDNSSRGQAAPAREGPTVQRRGRWGNEHWAPLEHAIVRWWWWLAPGRDKLKMSVKASRWGGRRRWWWRGRRRGQLAAVAQADTELPRARAD
jgi:hypothetical protein